MRSAACSRDARADRKSTRLNSSHVRISYAVFCLKKKNKAFLEQIWTSPEVAPADALRLRELMESLRVEESGRQLLESYKEAAIRSLPELRNPSLKGLLRRVIGKIFRVEIQGWCGEFEARNAANSETVTQAVG